MTTHTVLLVVTAAKLQGNFTQTPPAGSKSNSFAVFALSRPITQMSENSDPQIHQSSDAHTVEWERPEFEQSSSQSGERITIELPGEQQAAPGCHADAEPAHVRGHRVSLTAASVAAVFAGCAGAALALTIDRPQPQPPALRSTSTRTETTALGPRIRSQPRRRPLRPARSTTTPRMITRPRSDSGAPERQRAPVASVVVGPTSSPPVMGQADPEEHQSGAFSP
jgi:hypothetical protein